MTLWEKEAAAVARLFCCHVHKVKKKKKASCVSARQRRFLQGLSSGAPSGTPTPDCSTQLHIKIFNDPAAANPSPQQALSFPARLEYCSQDNVSPEIHSRALR